MKPNQIPRLCLMGLMTILFACAPKGHDEHDDHSGHDHGAQENKKDHSDAHDEPGDAHDEHGDAEDDHEGHNHGASTDLSKSVSDLFAEQCGHGIKTFECEDCRYEVGVVKVPKNMFDEKLVTLHAVQKRALSSALNITGEVQFDERRVTHVSTQVSGVIRKVTVSLGDSVTQGQPLIEIESVEVGNAKAVYHEALALETLVQQNHDRIETLRKEGISSQKEVITAKQELAAAKIRAAAAKGTLKRIGMGGGGRGGLSIQNSSGKLVLKAPADGNILNMHAVKGEIAQSNASLVTIGDNRSLWVWADLYEKDYARVRQNHAHGVLDAAVSVKAFKDTKFPGVLDYISPAMSELSRTVKIRFAVPNADGKLLAGMFAEIELFLPNESADAVLSVPASAVLEDDGPKFIFIHKQDDYYVRRPVETGRTFGNWVELTSGMNGTEQAVSNGAFLLKSDVLRSKMGAGCAH